MHEVLAWAEGRLQGSDTHTLYVETDSDDSDSYDVTLSRLAGTDPTQTDSAGTTTAVRF